MTRLFGEDGELGRGVAKRAPLTGETTTHDYRSPNPFSMVLTTSIVSTLKPILSIMQGKGEEGMASKECAEVNKDASRGLDRRGQPTKQGEEEQKKRAFQTQERQTCHQSIHIDTNDYLRSYPCLVRSRTSRKLDFLFGVVTNARITRPTIFAKQSRTRVQAVWPAYAHKHKYPFCRARGLQRTRQSLGITHIEMEVLVQ